MKPLTATLPDCMRWDMDRNELRSSGFQMILQDWRLECMQLAAWRRPLLSEWINCRKRDGESNDAFFERYATDGVLVGMVVPRG